MLIVNRGSRSSSVAQVLGTPFIQELVEVVNIGPMDLIVGEHALNGSDQLLGVANVGHLGKVSVNGVVVHLSLSLGRWLGLIVSLVQDQVVRVVVVAGDLVEGGGAESGDSDGPDVALDSVVVRVDDLLFEGVHQTGGDRSLVVTVEDHLLVTSLSVVDEETVHNSDLTFVVDHDVLGLDVSVRVVVVLENLKNGDEHLDDVPDFTLGVVLVGGQLDLVRSLLDTSSVGKLGLEGLGVVLEGKGVVIEVIEHLLVLGDLVEWESVEMLVLEVSAGLNEVVQTF